MEHDPNAVRADANRHANELSDMLNAYADLIERHAKLLKHAEAMALANIHDDAYQVSWALNGAVEAYRTDFPKD